MRTTSTTIATFFGVALLAHAGQIQGRVKTVVGLTKQRVTLPAYDLRGALVAPLKKSGAVDELSRVAVYLDGAGLLPGNPSTGELKQQHQRFGTDLLIVPAGSTVSFPNADPIFHNVFSLSRTKQFDLGYYPEGQTRTIRFEKLGVVQVYCHLHQNMNATLIIVPSAFYMRPQADGTFQFSGVPAGTYQIVVWHKAVGSLRHPISVPENGVVNIEIAIPELEPKDGR